MTIPLLDCLKLILTILIKNDMMRKLKVFSMSAVFVYGLITLFTLNSQPVFAFASASEDHNHITESGCKCQSGIGWSHDCGTSSKQACTYDSELNLWLPNCQLCYSSSSHMCEDDYKCGTPPPE